MPLIRRVRVMAAKIEGTAGTPESLSGSDGVFNIFNPVIQPVAELEQREGQGAFGRLAGVVGARMGRLTFQTELQLHGTGGSVPGWATTFLPACGWVNSGGVFSPKSQAPGSNVKTLTMGLYENGLYKQIHGAMGSFTISFPAGRRVLLDWEFMGCWTTPSDVAIIAPNYPDTPQPLRFASAALTLGGYGSKVEQVTIESGNQVSMREDASSATGYSTAIVGDRVVTGTMNPESSLVAGDDIYGDWLAGTEAAFSIELSNGTNDVTFSGDKCQIVLPQEGERNGVQTDDIQFQFNRASDAGDNEFLITFAAS